LKRKENRMESLNIQWSASFKKQLEENILSAAEKQRAGSTSIELTREERFTIAAYAGAKIEIGTDNKGLSFFCRTIHPCAVTWDGAKFIVSENRKVRLHE